MKKKHLNISKHIGKCYKRVYRLYCALKLNLKAKPKKRLAPRTAQKLKAPSSLNQGWSLDYMSDALVYGRRFRTANVIDECNREAIGILPAFSLPSKRITRWLDEIAHSRGYPDYIRLDNGPENISTHFKDWAETHNITLQFIQPGKPAQSAYIERFNRSYREEVLDMYLFQSIQQVKKITHQWMIHYNQNRPHQALNHLTPHAYAKKLIYQITPFMKRGKFGSLTN